MSCYALIITIAAITPIVFVLDYEEKMMRMYEHIKQMNVERRKIIIGMIE